MMEFIEEKQYSEVEYLANLERERYLEIKNRSLKWNSFSVLAILMPVLFPLFYIAIFNYLWDDRNNPVPVDPKNCSCPRWGRVVFKGMNESGISSYTHGTWNTFKMWSITVLGVIFLYECFKRLFRLLFLGELRYSMGLLFLSYLHSHYYGWWAHWNYWNDDFYELWHHQIFYIATEMVSAFLVVANLDARQSASPLPILIIATISLFHILSNGWDQFLYNVVQRKGQSHQVFRDILFMFPNFICIGISLYEIGIYSKMKDQAMSTIISQKKNAITIFITSLIMCISLY